MEEIYIGETGRPFQTQNTENKCKQKWEKYPDPKYQISPGIRTIDCTEIK
jgi:hypothetical protein